MQHLTIKRIPVKNANTVRYRVYRSADEFVAVIAENALMAMKLTGINEPYKVVRDLISEEGSVPESSLDKEHADSIMLSTTPAAKAKEKPDMRNFAASNVQGFTALSMGDLRKDNSMLEGVIASPKLLRVLEATPPEVQMPAEPETLQAPVVEEHVDVSPLDMAQQALVEKATPAEPLSAKDVVDLLSGKSD